MQAIFYDIGIIIIIATIGGFIARLIKQPLIPFYIAAGLIIGPVLQLITHTEIILPLSEIGIAFLLFIVGLEIDFKKLNNVAWISSLGTVIRDFLLFSLAFLIANSIGFIGREAVYIGFIVAFSSTMVVLKILSDQRKLGTLHGRIMIGMLLMEDIMAIFALSILTTINDFSLWFLFRSVLIAFTALGAALLVGKFMFPTLFRFAAKSHELLFLASTTMLFLFAILFNYLGFSIAIGAFIAGVALANLPYNIEIISKVKSLRDFFATIFFVSLGMQLVIGEIRAMILPILIFTLFVLLIKPLITMIIVTFFGYKKKPAYQVSASMAQMSEFSLIIVAQGLILGHISNSILTIAIIIAMVTISVTSYLMNFEEKIYSRIGERLSFFERVMKSHGKDLEYVPEDKKFEVILCGYSRIGYSILKKLHQLKKELLIIDYNPEVIRDLIKSRRSCIYGDVGDTEIWERIDLSKVSLVVSTVPEFKDSLLIIKKVKEKNKKAVIYVSANEIDEALTLYDQGADYVILAH
ncbi:cation:proton antiporter, partial [Candidatus Woesearchaeota archaeon]|nr:cation:proton antiporter [Candidatus Woesearchaeota archaeon]